MDRVLVIDDDAELCELLVEFLEPEGFQIDTVHDGISGVEQALAHEYSLIVLDVMLPRLGGFEVLRRIRAGSLSMPTSSTASPIPSASASPTLADISASSASVQGASVQAPILMLTARGEERERIVGLEIGADDYLAKPFNPRELLARIRAILRRARPPVDALARVAAEGRVGVGDVELDGGARIARRSGELLDLTGAEFDLLALLLRRAGSVVTRDEIALQVLERRLMPNDRSIDMHISNLRRKLGLHPLPSDAATPSEGAERIKSVRGSGYIYTRPESE